jgi:4-amino-4-deoxy-L-arabinose transferase-like glycosyltransferase
MRLQQHLPTIALVTVLIAARLIWNGLYPAIEFPDSATYRTLARQIEAMSFAGYDGTRTPGYPLILILLRHHATAIVVFQQALGVLTAWLVCRLVMRFTGRTALAVATALIVGLSPNAMAFESAVLTETLAAFLVTAIVWLSCRIHARGLTIAHAAWLGGALALIGLTRPNLLYLGPLVMLAVLWAERARRGSLRPAAVAAVVTPCLALTLAWCGFNHHQTGYFGPTTYTGYNLTQHAGGFMELAPEEHAVLRDIYLRHRAQVVRLRGTHAATVFWAEPEMRRVTGMSFVALSRALGTMSIELFKAHPQRYAESVFKAYQRFWQVPDYVMRGQLRQAQAIGWVDLALETNRLVHVHLIMAFMGLGAIAVTRVAARPLRLLGPTWPLLMAGAAVMAGAVLQALVEYGENARYYAPFQAIVVALVAVGGYRLAVALVRRIRATAPAAVEAP